MRSLTSLAWRVALALALTAGSAASAAAQITSSDDTSQVAVVDSSLHRFAERWSGTLALGVMEPVGVFRQTIGSEIGLEAEAAFRLDRRGWLALRAAASSVNYGRERTRVPLLTSTGRILVDVVTDYSMFSMGFGPKLAVPGGPVRPYVAGGIGFTHFNTSSHIDRQNSEQDDYRTHHQSDTRLAWLGSGGLMVPLHLGKSAMQLDFGVTYNGGGTARYLRPGDIKENGDGTISFTEREGPTRFLMYRVGMRFGR